jgi:serine/threonine-protein kinase
LPLSPGQLLLHYRVVDKIAQGGMGEVWRAVDTRLHREVAVKVIPDHLGSDPDALARFEREARAVAAISHPNILALYDVGRDGNISYAVTELLEGATLRDRLAGESLPPPLVLEFAIQIAQGLASAHARGVIHRDLKPENIFITTEGQLKLLDFGLARFPSEAVTVDGVLVDEAAATRATPTIPGTVLGTPGYMSPEQVRGEATDARSDLFSLGSVVYEMLTGQRAFRGRSIPDILSAVLNEEPPMTEGRSNLEAAIQNVVRRCLRKRPEERYASAREVVQALQGATKAGASSAPDEPSIAVLPFVDMSQEKDQDYFCEGIAEEILSALSGIPGLRVAARTSTFRFKGNTQDVRQIGRELGVNSLLEGSVRTVGKRLRVSAQLINAADGYRVWSERYDREMEDVFAIQDEIARSVVRALPLQRGAPETGGAARKHSDDMVAYHLYLKGRHERYTTRNFAAALRRFEEAVERDPRYALAHAGIAETMILIGNTSLVRPRIAFARAETELEYAKALAGETVETLTVEGMLRAYHAWDWAGAQEVHERAIALDPGYIFARTWLSLVLSARGRAEEAVAMARSAVSIDPLAPLGWTMTGWALGGARRLAEAESPLREALKIDPRHTLSMWILGVTLIGLGRRPEGLSVLERAVETEPRSSLLLGMRAWALAVNGRHDDARAGVDALRDWAKHGHIPRYTMAWTLGALGEIDSALDEYERSVDEHDAFLIFPLFPGNDPYRREPRFIATLQRMGLDWAIAR